MWPDSFISVTWLIYAVQLGASVCSEPGPTQLQHQRLGWPLSRQARISQRGYGLQHTAKHAATNCNTLQDTTTHCNILQYCCGMPELVNTGMHYYTRQHTSTHYNTLQHTATHCNSLHHCSAKSELDHADMPPLVKSRVVGFRWSSRQIQWAISHVWMSHGTLLSESHDTYEGTVLCIWMRR